MEALKTYGWILAVVGPICGAIGAMVTMAIRTRPQLAKIKADGDAALVAKLMARVEALEKQVELLQKQVEQERARHAAIEQITRHALANERQANDALLMLWETSPDKIPEHIHRIKAMRAEQADRLAMEKATITGAQLKGQD